VGVQVEVNPYMITGSRIKLFTLLVGVKISHHVIGCQSRLLAGERISQVIGRSWRWCDWWKTEKKPACDRWRPEEASLWLVEAWRSQPVIGGALGGDGEVAKDVWNELLLVVPLLTRAIRSPCRTPESNNIYGLITFIFKGTGSRECAGCIFIHRMWMLLWFAHQSDHQLVYGTWSFF
jgi:hypothetical protein